MDEEMTETTRRLWDDDEEMDDDDEEEEEEEEEASPSRPPRYSSPAAPGHRSGYAAIVGRQTPGKHAAQPARGTKLSIVTFKPRPPATGSWAS